MMFSLIFHAASIINRKNWRITIKLDFENLSIFFEKSERTHTLGPPFALFVFVRFQRQLPFPLRRTYFLNDPYGSGVPSETYPPAYPILKHLEFT